MDLTESDNTIINCGDYTTVYQLNCCFDFSRLNVITDYIPVLYISQVSFIIFMNTWWVNGKICVWILGPWNCTHSLACVLFCHALVMVDFYHILQGYFTGTGAIIWLPQCQWSNPEGDG